MSHTPITHSRQVLKRAAVQTDAAAAAAHLLQLESLCGALDTFVEARKRALSSVPAPSQPAPASAAKVASSAAGKGGKKDEDAIAAPSAKRPRPSSDAPTASAGAASARQAAAAPSSAGEAGEELTLHVRHAFEIRELSLRKL